MMLAYGSLETCRWIEQAAAAGAQSVLVLPPNAFRADRAAVIEHYRAAASVGLPVVAYNNPYDTKVDLTPDLLAELHGEGLIVAVKEFTGDVRRAYEIRELAPELDLLIGTDDVLLEMGLAGAVGWIAGYPNALPRASKKLYDLTTSGRADDIEQALPIYRDLHPLTTSSWTRSNGAIRRRSSASCARTSARPGAAGPTQATLPHRAEAVIGVDVGEIR